MSNSGHFSLIGGDINKGIISSYLEKYYSNKDLGFSVSGQYKTTEKADLSGAAGDNNWTENMENFETDISLSAKLKF